MSEPISISVDDREVRRMLQQYQNPEMRNRLRRGTRAGAAEFRKAIRSEARSTPGIPDSFGKTASKSGTRPEIYSGVRPASPLWNIFEEGADTHEIAPGRLNVTGRKLLMSGKAGQRWRSRDFAASMPVRHPGMKARPFTGPIFRSRLDAARRAAATTIFGEPGLALFGLDGDE